MPKEEIVPPNFKAEVIDDYYGHKQLKVYVENIGTFGFTVNHMSEQDRDWLVSVVSEQMKTIHEKSFNLGRDSVINRFKALFGILK